MGEGGCVSVKQRGLKILVESFRDWGRDCRCGPGEDNSCRKRFDWKLGDLPFGYDHKYCYSHIGYNLKATDMQAAVGVSPIEKIACVHRDSPQNFQTLHQGLSDLSEFFIMPEATAGSIPSWFGFPITVRDGAPIGRSAVMRYLEEHKIATRLLFGGNLIRQPAYLDKPYRVAGDLKVSDTVMNQTFWVGIYPGISQPMMDYVLDVFHRIPKFALQAGDFSLVNPGGTNGYTQFPRALFIFEMANNHMGLPEHGLREFENSANRKEFHSTSHSSSSTANWIHSYIPTTGQDGFQIRKAFPETRLTADQYKILQDEIKAKGFVTICTPFDEASVDLIEEHDFDIIKVASCSFTDWPLLERIVKTKKPIIASTAGIALAGYG